MVAFYRVSTWRPALFRAIGAALFAVWLLLAFALSVAAQVNVLTQHNDNARTGANLSETLLNTSNVNSNQFGKLYARPVDGQIYAQPLVVSGVNIPGKGVRNVVLVATMHNTLYAFDADATTATPAFWQTSLGTSVPVPNPYFGNRYGAFHDIQIEIGTLSTPVIDLPNQTLYCVAFTQDVDGGPYHQKLHALDITTGQERPNSPVEISGSAPGNGYGQDFVSNILDRQNGQIIFNPMQAMQRPALLLSKGTLFIAFGSHADTDPYHGWVFAYNAQTLQQKGLFCLTPDGNEGGIWQSGQGLATDDNGNLFFMTGNGTYDGNTNFGDTFLKLQFSGAGLTVGDWFTPYNQAFLEQVDADLGSAGVMLIPGTNLLVGGGKEGRLFLLNRDSMGQYNPNGDTQVVQWFWAYGGHLHGSPVYWNSPNGALVYLWSENDHLRAYKLNGGLFDTNPFAVGGPAVPSGMPGGMLSVSANGSTAGTGIVWAAHPYSGDANPETRPGILRAFDASNLNELWNSYQNQSRDDLGNFAKFCPPTVANGKVYLATFSNQLVVYGLGNWVATPVITPNGGEFTGPVSVTMTCATSGAEMRYTTDGSDPTKASPLYTGAFTLQTSAVVKAKAFKTGLNESGVALSNIFIGDPPGDGDGLQATYYGNIDLTGATFLQIDPTVNFDWGGASPAPGIPATNWSARWTGFVQPRNSGAITFTTVTDDGVRLWVDNQLVIDNWTYHAPTEDNGTITLVAGQKYAIKMEFFQGGGGSVAQLYWSSLGLARQIIPQSQLYSGATPTAQTPQIVPNGGAFFPSLSVTITDATFGADIRYTTDGTTPTTASLLYSGSFTLTNTATVKALAFKTGLNSSNLASADFRLTPPGSVLSVNFVGGGPNGNPAPMDATEVAGVVALSHWNNAFDRSGSLFSLVNDLGGVTSANVSWTCDNIWSINIAEAPGNRRMMKGYLDTGGANPTTVQVSNLPALFTSGGYDVFVYADGDNGAARTGNYTIGNQTLSLTDPGGVDFNDVFRLSGDGANGNYLVFSGVTGSNFTLTATPGAAADGVARAPVNGIQIIAHPAVTVAGTVTLQDCLNAVQPMTFQFRPLGGGTPFTRTATLNANGAFSLTGVPIGNYAVAIKGSKWLQQVVTADARQSDVTNLAATLPAGDADNNNVVDFDDLTILAIAYNTAFDDGSGFYDDRADFNCDGQVEFADLTLLAINYNLSGDP